MIFPASPPASFVPVTTPAHVPPFNSVVNKNPCGKQTVASVGGVNVQSQNLCLAHYAAAWGAVSGAIVFGT
jgi:hypothetical protein